MTQGTGKVSARSINRRDFLRLSGASLAGATLLGSAGMRPIWAQTPDTNGALLLGEIEAASKEYAVPADLLIAMGWVNSRLYMSAPDANVYERGDLHGWGSYGVMGLVQNPSSNTLGDASRLTGLSEERLKTDRAANIRGGAALLASASGSAQSSSSPSSLLGAVAGSGAGVEYRSTAGVGGGSLYEEQVKMALGDGVPERLRRGDASLFASPKLDPDDGLDERSALRIKHKPPHIWRPAAANNYTSANRPRSHRINKIIIHVTQGSWAGATRWFTDPRAGVSAHYTIRSRDGKICQSVSDLNIAYHAGNWNYNKHSIGIEHEGYINRKKWFTPQMFRSSAKLVAYLCRRYKIKPNRRNIIGHNEVPGSDHRDPGPWWWWSYYMKRVRKFHR